jgi:retron-type reverse transcriptase
MTGRNTLVTGKPFPITKRMVWEAYLAIRGKGKAAGVDRQSLEDFEDDLKNNLYRLWNRLASGSYFPSPVRRVEIPKGKGAMRPLGIPTVSDWIAQMVVKRHLEPDLAAISTHKYAIHRASLRERCFFARSAAERVRLSNA